MFTCEFDLSLYPFDEQQCALQLQLKSVGEVIYSSNSSVTYTGTSLLLEYQVGIIYIDFTTNSDTLQVCLLY